jgi:hypothetical protein
MHVKAQDKCALQRVSYSEFADQTELGVLPWSIVASYNANARFEQPRLNAYGVLHNSTPLHKVGTYKVLPSTLCSSFADPHLIILAHQHAIADLLRGAS